MPWANSNDRAHAKASLFTALGQASVFPSFLSSHPALYRPPRDGTLCILEVQQTNRYCNSTASANSLLRGTSSERAFGSERLRTVLSEPLRLWLRPEPLVSDLSLSEPTTRPTEPTPHRRLVVDASSCHTPWTDFHAVKTIWSVEPEGTSL